jgi:hypothetical protein
MRPLYLLTLLISAYFADCLAADLNDLTYQVNAENTVTITGCDSAASGELIIPTTIEGYPVTTIGESAFYFCTELTNIDIPSSVTAAGAYAFYGCSGGLQALPSQAASQPLGLMCSTAASD